MKTVLLTGAAGFVGSHFVEHYLEKTDWNIICLVRTSTVGDLHKILDNPKLSNESFAKRIRIVYCDLQYGINDTMNERIGKVDYIVHLAANSHVDRSIKEPVTFVLDNVLGTTRLLEWMRVHNPQARFLNFSTDEVYGPIEKPYKFKEEDRYRPSNPYAASKCGQSAMAHAYYVTYKLDVLNTYTMNIFGERQNPEKLIPKAIAKIQRQEAMPVFAELNEEGKLVGVGERHWLHARNAADATLYLLEKGVSGEHYNIVGDTELTNEEVVRTVAKIMGKEPIIEYVDFHKTRPGHDRRYALDGTKLKELGWVPPVTFEEAMTKVVNWTLENPVWLH